MSRIAIVGGHGKIALLAAGILSADGHTVTSLIRRTEQRTDIEGVGATASIVDLESASSDELAGVFRDHDAVVFSAGAGGGSAERTRAVDRDAAIRTMDAAGAAGVQRYVMVSYLGAGPEHGIATDDPFYAYAESKAAADTHLRSADLAWTVLGPSALSDDPATGAIEVDPSESGSVARGPWPRSSRRSSQTPRRSGARSISSTAPPRSVRPSPPRCEGPIHDQSTRIAHYGSTALRLNRQ